MYDTSASSCPQTIDKEQQLKKELAEFNQELKKIVSEIDSVLKPISSQLALLEAAFYACDKTMLGDEICKMRNKLDSFIVGQANL